MSSVEGARFGAWFDRLQAMVLHALDRLSRADALSFVPEDLARLLGVDAACVVIGLDGAEAPRAAWFVGGPGGSIAPCDEARAIAVAEMVDAPRVLGAD